MAGDPPRCYSQSLRSNEDTLTVEDHPRISLRLNSSMPGVSHQEDDENGATASAHAFADRETSSGADHKEKAADVKCISKANLDTSEDQHKWRIEAAQKQAMYATATLEIQAVLGSCTFRKDNITIDDMDLVHEKFDAFMRSHPTLSEGYMRLTGWTIDPPSMPPRRPPNRPANFNQQEGPRASPLPCILEASNQFQPTLPNLHHPTVNAFQRPCDDTVNINQELLKMLLLHMSTHRTEHGPAVAIADGRSNKECSQSTDLAAAALIALLEQHGEPPPEVAGPAPAPATQDNYQPSSNSIELTRTTSRNLRRMGLNPSEELLPGLPDRRPYTRPDKPYQGPPRGRPVVSGRRRRHNIGKVSNNS